MSWRRRDEQRKVGRRAAGGLAAITMAVTVAAAAGPAPAAGHPAGVGRSPELRAWVVDGRLAAVRRSALPPGAYGGHGVDYTPLTWPVAVRGRGS